jgi:CRISPR system Cascade subunit CasE
MFLSQLLVNPGSHPDKPRPGVEWIKQTYRVHQRIWMAFPSTNRVKEDPFFLGTWTGEAVNKPQRAESGFLFRIEPEPPLRILVQSVTQPNWEYAFQNAPHLLAGPPQVRRFEPRFTVGQMFRFRLVMQMVTRRTIPKSQATQIVGKHRSEHPIPWSGTYSDDSGNMRNDLNGSAWRAKLERSATSAGFDLSPFLDLLRVRPVSNLFMKCEFGQPPQPFHAGLFDGQLTCTDPERLRASVLNGIGRGKAFGMGLLSLASIQ